MKNKTVWKETGAVFLNSLFLKNPVVISALGIYPVVVGSYSLKSALELSLMMVLIAVPVNLILCAVGELLPNWLRPGVVLLVSAAFYLPAGWVTERVFPGALAMLGTCGAWMVCNSMVLSRANEYAPSHIGWAAAADALGCSVGFSLIVCAFAVVREIIHCGDIWGVTTSLRVVQNKGILLPFFGFIMLGFLAALVQWMNGKRSGKKKRKVQRP